jgi:large subunit ribosomal protein L5e
VHGTLDGGLNVLHSEKRFIGFKKDEKQLDVEMHLNNVFGGHVANQMRYLIEGKLEKYNSRFS